ncbi:MAG: DUF1835 domain-containing protein [Chitinophagaceae bacterium]|jgi:hypothetical protein|nr:DUF1835 domain-containing protein [Chitinophagaceae bacterium]
MIHLVFEPSGAKALHKSFELDESLEGKIIVVKDDFAVGPVFNIYEEEGYRNRKTWWENVLQYSPYAEQLHHVEDKHTVHRLIKEMKEDATLSLWIWMGQNQHDVCGYYWLINQLKEFQGRVYILYLNNLPFISEKGSLFYPTHLSQIQSKEFIKAKKLARMITLGEFELDPDEWKKLCDANATVRILEGGKKIINKEADFYDKDILDALGNETIRLPKLLHSILNRMKIKTGDAFLAWRIREMTTSGRLMAQGNWEKGWKDMLLKAATGNMFETIDAANETTGEEEGK